ncbi:lysine biosynthesis enzyme LysX [Candidatus Roizmanbacteria bacterium RIFCSPHIGHO2_01_FULL_39_12c]|uniref:Lysine biosynthesis enzyme LysX n=1 Tax=Candidatus Roizmanbacteria bacterium RIFCSPHIGHO2_01_FULL_39_12c TaxID=1802031 RepID=A0A1F7GF48_9BACT|nr:MAG: lysine biosynthesis enzyme LysX [Candidatus Roizmanbacteria bacterium RIFCSPHIGHO2_01_FULL_39_12c]OGK46884.1 MAG: lysine biosynthesis enzyme LysX [Candidatus Roizmanbacteria bacterium RIFCSPLOWO2_01_FULL_40_13]
MVTIGLLHTTIRGDEKLILEAAKQRNVKIRLIDVRKEIFNRNSYRTDYNIVLNRCVSTIKGNHATHFFESLDLTVINNSKVSAVCEDKFVTSLALQKAGVPTPEFAMVFNANQAHQAINQLGGFPVVIKPPLGSWGRLLAKINDFDSLEAILEHKDVLGSPHQKSFYIQKYIKKPGRDIRAFVIEGKTICTIYRHSPHWITNTARGGVATNCPISKEISNLSKKASAAVGGGILSMDIFETDSGLQINEINHTTEFKNSEKPTGVSISGAIVDYCLKVAKKI